MDILERIREADLEYKRARITEYEAAAKRVQAYLDARNRLIATAVDAEGKSIRQVALKGLGKKNPTGAKNALEAGRAL